MVNVERWIDLDSEEAKKNITGYHDVRRFLTASLEAGAIKPDKLGYLYTVPSEKSQYNPVHVTIGGKLIGLRYVAKAPN